MNHHTQITEAGVQEIATCSATGVSEEDASTIVSLCSIEITSINRDILKQVEGSNRNGNMHMTSGVGNNRQPISSKSHQQETSGSEKYASRVHPTSDKGNLLISCSSKNIPTTRNMERGKEVKKEGKSRQRRRHYQSSQIIREGRGNIKSLKGNNKVLLFQIKIV